MTEIEFRYFRSVKGHIVPRHGTQTFIGAKRDKVEGWVWTDEVMRIPATEVTRYLREYNRALTGGAIVEVKKSDYDKCQKELEAKATKAAVKASKGEED